MGWAPPFEEYRCDALYIPTSYIWEPEKQLSSSFSSFSFIFDGKWARVCGFKNPSKQVLEELLLNSGGRFRQQPDSNTSIRAKFMS